MMKSQSLKALMKTPAGYTLLVCLLLILCSWIYLFFQFTGEAGNLFPGEQEISALKTELEKARTDCDAEEEKMRAAESLKKLYADQCARYWKDEAFGDVETSMRERIAGAASERGVRLNSLGSVRTSRINGELSYAEIEVSLSDGFEDIMNLIAGIAELKPELSWRRIDIRPEFRRTPPPGRAESGGTVQAEDTEQKFRFSGTLRVICVEDQSTTQETEASAQ